MADDLRHRRKLQSYGLSMAQPQFQTIDPLFGAPCSASALVHTDATPCGIIPGATVVLLVAAFSCLNAGCSSSGHAARELVVEGGTSQEIISALGPMSNGSHWPEGRVFEFSSVAVNESKNVAIIAHGSPADSLSVYFVMVDSADPGGAVLAEACAGGLLLNPPTVGSIKELAEALTRTLGKPVRVRVT